VRIALEAPGILVVDELLPAAVFAALNREVDAGEYHSVHARSWDRAWRLWDGSPLRGPSVYYDPTGARAGEGAAYPTSTSLDPFFDSVRQIAASCPQVAGSEGVDWVAMYLSPWLYPVGSALSPHLDGGAYSGAFTFFAHTSWKVHWGGELLVMDAAPAGDGGWRSSISEDDGIEAELPLGVASCVFPRPNRLVLVGPDRPHMIRRVDANAGAHVRASLAGFFLRP
jgi:hypothetical protein